MRLKKNNNVTITKFGLRPAFYHISLRFEILSRFEVRVLLVLLIIELSYLVTCNNNIRSVGCDIQS